MALEHQQFHLFFLPFMAPGHMIPTRNLARLFTTRGIKSTVVTTPANVCFFAEFAEIEVLTMKFPSKETGLPEGYENADSMTSPDMLVKFIEALSLFQHPFENLVKQHKPDCLVVDYFFPWISTSATKFGIPWLSFSGSSYFSECIISNLLRYKPHKKVSSDSETLVVPGNLPHEIKLAMSELSPLHKGEGPNFILDLMNQAEEAQKSRYGLIMNSFYELESVYADYVGNELGSKHWHLGPISLYFKKIDWGNQRGKKSCVDVIHCMKWLDRKQANSVIYICMGSMSNVTDDQLHEMAIALESLGQDFILVVRKEDTKEWIPEGFEERVKEQGLIIRGWAPQELILDHTAVGWFVTHCGWNSILEGVVGGVPMLTWPLHAEQFYNEKLITDVLKIGLPVGSKKWLPRIGGEPLIMNNQNITMAMKELMLGEGAQEMRNRANELKQMARKAISEGGSSCSDLNSLIEELKCYKN